MLTLRKKSCLRVFGAFSLIVIASGCGSRGPQPPSHAEIQAQITRIQNDPNMPPVAKQQALREQQLLLQGSK